MNSIPKAQWWSRERDADGKTSARCDLCFRTCAIPRDGTGYCGVRFFSANELRSPYLGRFASVAIDPVEKKPLRRWRPGTRILSLGGIGCNMSCPFCQNHVLSQPTGDLPLREIPPAALLKTALAHQVPSVAYTYNEPTLQAEYIFTAAPLLREHGIATVLVTNGLYSEALRPEVGRWVEAANVDVKTFDPEIYRSIGGSLSVVTGNVEALATAGTHVELTCLVVPGISDSCERFADMVNWIAEISGDIPLHISRYFPAFHYSAPPTDRTLMETFRAIAEKKLRHVYQGNV